MSEILPRTVRKLVRQTQNVSFFNPESSMKQDPSQKNSMFNRKSQSKRYNKLNQNQMIKTINFSDLRTHRKTFSVNRQKQFQLLPEINIPKNKRGVKKGSFFEIWLNQALDEGQSPQSFIESVNDQNLDTLKNYRLDKKLLRYKNISEQNIQKIYKKLYIYSRGLSAGFDQISKLASSNTFPQEHQGQAGNELTQIFWRAFTKIMQNQTPYENSFRAIQKRHLKTIQQLKQHIQKMNSRYESQLNLHYQQTRKTTRQLQRSQKQLNQFQNQFNVMKSTLQLTEKTLQDQVVLRLRFEQKINSVYTSYEQIKGKYLSLVEDKRIKSEYSSGHLQVEKQLKDQLQSERTKTEGLQYLLQIQKGRVNNLEAQVRLKKQQLDQLQQQILTINQSSNKQQDQISILIKRNKLTFSLLEKQKIDVQRWRQNFNQQKTIASKFQRRIQELAQSNDDLYADKLKVYEESQNLGQQNQLLRQQNININKQNQFLENKTKSLQQNLSFAQEENKLKQAQIVQLSAKLKANAQLLTKAKQTLEKLKQVKDRQERLQDLAQIQKKQAIEQKILVQAKMHQQQIQIEQLAKQIQERKVQQEIINNKYNKSKQLLTKKDDYMKDIISKKQKSISGYLKAIQEERNKAQTKQRQLIKLTNQLQQKQASICNIQSKNLYLQVNQPLLELKLHQKQLEIKTKQQRSFQNKVKQTQLRSRIHQIQTLLNIKNSQIHLQIDGYKKLSQMYKQIYQQRKQYVHPMVYQDLLASAGKFYQESVQSRKQVLKIRVESENITQMKKRLEIQCQEAKQEIRIESQKNRELTEWQEQVQRQNDKLTTNLEQQINKNTILTHNQQKLKQDMESLKKKTQCLTKQGLIIKQENHRQRQQIQQLTLSSFKTQELRWHLSNDLQQTRRALSLFGADDEKVKRHSAVLKLQRQVQMQLQLSAIYSSNALKENGPIGQDDLKINQIQSEQLTQALIQQSQKDGLPEENYKLEIIAQQSKQPSQNKNNRTIPKNQKKKVENRQFKRALKLTFMKR